MNESSFLLTSGSHSSYARVPGVGPELKQGMAVLLVCAVSRLAEYEVNDPAPTDMRPQTPAVVQDVVPSTARVLERVGENGHRTELPRLVHRACQSHHRLCAPSRRSRKAGTSEHWASDKTASSAALAPRTPATPLRSSVAPG